MVGDDVTYERKMREMIVASRLESPASKDEILELYLNSIYLGRGAWGIELAARNFFGKSAKGLTVPRGRSLRDWPKVRTFSARSAILSAPRNASPTCSGACRKTA